MSLSISLDTILISRYERHVIFSCCYEPGIVKENSCGRMLSNYFNVLVKY